MVDQRNPSNGHFKHKPTNLDFCFKGYLEFCYLSKKINLALTSGSFFAIISSPLFNFVNLNSLFRKVTLVYTTSN